jgi:hypothetical protein
VYRRADGLEIAYTPEIDGIPNVLQASDSIQAYPYEHPRESARGLFPAIANWLQPLALTQSSGAFPRDRAGKRPLPPSTSLQLSTALYNSF